MVAPNETPSRRGWKLIREAARSRRRGLALGVTAGLAWSAAKVAVPWLVQRGIDQGIDSREMSSILRWSLIIAIVGLISAVATGSRRYLAFREARAIEADLRGRLVDHMLGLHPGFFDRTSTGELMSRATTDLQQIQNFIVMAPITISNIVTVLIVVVVLLTIDPVLAVLALAGLPVVNFLGRRFSYRLLPAVAGIQRESAELAGVVEEAVAGVRVVKGLGAESTQSARLKEEADDLYEVATEAAQVRSRYTPAIELMPNLGLIMVLLVGGNRVMDGRMTVGELVAFNVYVVLLIWPLRSLGFIIGNAQRAVASADRVAEIFETTSALPEAVNPVPLPSTTGASEVRFAGVSFTYDVEGAEPVLRDLDLVIQPGESVALVGGTGSGKSTIARLVARFHDVSDGQITLDGVPLPELALDDVRRSVAIVFEETFLFAATIAENIAFAKPEADRATIERAAALSGAADFISKLDDGYDTVVGERGFSLSGGQRQRIAIARAIVADPRVLILDDATSSVDPTKEHEIRDSLGSAMEGRTTIVIAHRPATIALADRVVVIDDGRVVAEGTHRELQATDARYRRILALGAAATGTGHGDGDVITAEHA